MMHMRKKGSIFIVMASLLVISGCMQFTVKPVSSSGAVLTTTVSTAPKPSESAEINDKIKNAPLFLLEQISKILKKPIQDITAEDILTIKQINVSNETDKEYNLSLIGEMKNLNALQIINVKVKNFDFLSHLTKLLGLEIHQFQRQQLPPLENMKTLKYLALVDGDLTNIQLFLGLPALQSINVANNRIQDISLLQSFKNLTSVKISGNPVHNIDVVKQIPELTRFEMMNTSVDNLDVFSQSRRLRMIDIRNTKVTSIKPIAQLPKLQIVLAFAQQIKDLYLLPNTVEISDKPILAY